MALTVHGTVAPGFEPVADAFRANFVARGEVGASVAVYQHGERKVHLWAGVADTASGRPWAEDTLTTMFSATKGLVATAFLMMVDRGELDVDRPLAFYWPELAHGAGAHISVRTWLNHRSGLSAVDTPLTVEDFADPKKIEAALVRQEPLWRPDTAQGYGATSWGMYAQALFRRLAGETVGAWLRREVFEPLGADVYLGTPASEHHRVATTYQVPNEELLRVVLPKIVRHDSTEGRVYRAVLFDRSSIPHRAFINPSMGRERLERVNDPMVRSMELPWVNANGTADGVARVYAALANAGRFGRTKLVRKATIDQVLPKQSWTNDDLVLRKPLGYSQGFIKDEPHIISPEQAAFGHTGAGGTVGFADPVRGLGVAYVMNRMDHHIRSPRCIALCRAVYASVEGWR
ncbi:MAG: beta-lactamase family protein [Alphaproteobacteria bacterium]|nr:beta-lactamase family protein [Alphaproteobacteria bacterium]